MLLQWCKTKRRSLCAPTLYPKVIILLTAWEESKHPYAQRGAQHLLLFPRSAAQLDDKDAALPNLEAMVQSVTMSRHNPWCLVSLHWHTFKNKGVSPPPPHGPSPLGWFTRNTGYKSLWIFPADTRTGPTKQHYILRAFKYTVMCLFRPWREII